MKQLFVTYVVIFFSVSHMAWAVRPVLKTRVSVRFDQSFYDLEFTQDVFKYREGTRTYGIKIKDCNRPQIDKIANDYKDLLAGYSRGPARAATKYDVELSMDGKKIEVARGSELGSWLREMPKKIMYWHAEAQASCRK